MFSLDKVLVVVDSEQQEHQAVQRALQLEQVVDCKLELVSSEYTPYLESGFYFENFQIEPLKEEHMGRVRKVLASIANPLTDQGLDVEIDVFWGNPAYEELVRKIVQSRPDLVIYSTRYHSKLSRFIFSNQDWQLLRSCPVPILVAGEQPWKPNSCVIAAVDPTHQHDKPSELDLQILNAAKTLTEKWGGELHVFHGVEDYRVSNSEQARLFEQHADKLNTLLMDFPVDSNKIHLMTGDIDKNLVDLAKQLNANTVVMGVVSRGRVLDAFVGNTAEKVIDTLSCDVLAIKPNGFRIPVKYLPLQDAQ